MSYLYAHTWTAARQIQSGIHSQETTAHGPRPILLVRVSLRGKGPRVLGPQYVIKYLIKYSIKYLIST